MFKFLGGNKSDFEVKHIDRQRRIVVIEDPSLGLECEVPFGEFDIASAEIVGPYTVVLSYVNGQTKVVRFLK